MIRKLSLAVAAACLFAPVAVLAQAAPAPETDTKTQTILSHMPKQIVDCQVHDAAREGADARLTQAAMALLTKHDVAALVRKLPDYQAAAAHAPDRPSLPEKCGTKLILFSDDMMDMLLASALTGKPETGISSVEQRAPLPYARLDFVIGWTWFEQKALDKAAGWYERGLSNDPRDVLLASEYANTLALLGRSAEALSFADTFLAENDDLPEHAKAQMLRRRGYALGELGRHDEAIAAYQDSLKLDPDSDVAKKDIAWNQSKLGAH